jgi:hypothetical protein
MKFINSINGTVVLHVAGDDVVPATGAPQQKVIELIGSAFHFTILPQVQIGAPVGTDQPLLFQSGFLAKDGRTYAILQIASVMNADIVTAIDTSAADLILDDYIDLLDREMGFRFASAKKHRTYVSNIVIQFENGLDTLKGIHKIEKLLNLRLPKRKEPYNIKRLSFGYGVPIAVPTLALDISENVDFALERRAGHPYSENRYFCTAPLSTTEHIKIMEELEASLSE